MHAGAFVKDSPGAALDIDGCRRSIDQIQFHGGTANGGTANGGTTIIFQSHGLSELEDDQMINAYQVLDEECEQFFGFEFAEVFAVFGTIYSLEVFPNG